MTEKIKKVGDRWKWRDEAGTLTLWLSSETLERHVRAALATHGITEPTGQQYVQAFKACQQLSYWQGVLDPEVHFERVQPAHHH